MATSGILFKVDRQVEIKYIKNTMTKNNTLFSNIVALPEAYSKEVVMADPKKLKMHIIDYFTLLKTEEMMPTPPGLATHIGLRGFNEIINILKIEEDQPGTYLPASLDCLELAKSYIEDAYIQGGLRDALPSQFVKFLLSAFFNRKEKTAAEIEADTTITVHIAGLTEQPKTIPVGTIDKEVEGLL